MIFLCIFFLSNIAASIFTALNTEQDLTFHIRNQLINSVETAKGIYEKEGISQKSLENLFDHNYIAIRFTKDLEQYSINNEEIGSLDKGESLLVHRKKPGSFEFSLPIAVIKTDDSYIVAQVMDRSMGFSVRHFIMTTNMIAIIIGSILFLFAGKMIVKPIRRLTKATEKIATGDFDIDLKSGRKDEIGTLITSFNMMAEELKSIEILRNDFVSDISHEFKTPLTSIEGYTKLLKICDEEERKEYIDIITEETRRLSILATSILMLNRIENENIPNSIELFSMDEQIRKAIVLLENMWLEKDIEFEIDLEDVDYKGNKNLMYQVWINLTDNAIKFSKEKDTIEVKLYKDDDNIIFTLKDNGEGISLEDQGRIFEKFYKTDKSRSSHGNGLGLSIVKRIIDIHGGKVFIESEVGKGTKIIIKL
jgi:signal transduction histidine kinase